VGGALGGGGKINFKKKRGGNNSSTKKRDQKMGRLGGVGAKYQKKTSRIARRRERKKADGFGKKRENGLTPVGWGER